MKKYRFRLQSDSGLRVISTYATCLADAVRIICNVEICPEGAIKGVTILKGITFGRS